MPLAPYPFRTSPFHGGKRWDRDPRVGRRRRVEWPEYALAGQHPERLTLTPELKLLGEQARDLQLQLNDRSVDPVAAAEAGRRIFKQVGDDVRAQWLNLELNGYGHHVDVRPLHMVLGVSVSDRLAAHVTAYRTQRGLTSEESGTSKEFRHFFVESLPELVNARDAVLRSGGSSFLNLEFGPHPNAPLHPKSGSFGRDVFERVLGGFVAALHLQLGALRED